MGTTGLSNISLAPRRLDQVVLGKQYEGGHLKATIHWFSVDASGAYAPELATALDSPAIRSDVQWCSQDGRLTFFHVRPHAIIRLYDLHGRCIHQQHGRTDRVSIPLARGVYVVQVIDASGCVTGKVFSK